MQDASFLQSPGRVLSTLEKDGSRRWLYPKLSKGSFWTQRRLVAYFLIALFNLIPFIPINGHPAMLLDVVHRKFHLFGMTFLPTDTVLLALFMVSYILGIFFVTALLGRIWCGWACPQTVYMEYVFRPIERLFLGRSGVGGKPKDNIAGWRRPAMYLVYLVICAHLSNIFLAYFVPVNVLYSWTMSPPWVHPAGFMIVAFVTCLMMFDFAYWREQMCIIGCPYGRLQSVLLDRNSMIISYDVNRGEPRGKGKRVSLPVAERSEKSLGDCVDCNLCAAVCPTGIDIRDGLQIECVGCAQCIDVCNGVMDKVGLARGLIRYSSQNRMSGDKQRILRPRVVIYSLILIVLISLLITLIVTHKPFDLAVLRGKGTPFNYDEKTRLVENRWMMKLTNRSDASQTFAFDVPGHTDIAVKTSQPIVAAKAGEMITEPIILVAPAGSFVRGKLMVELRVKDNTGVERTRQVELLGPANGGMNHVSENKQTENR